MKSRVRCMRFIKIMLEGPVTTRGMAERFGLSVRTINRYKIDARRAGFEIVSRNPGEYQIQT